MTGGSDRIILPPLDAIQQRVLKMFVQIASANKKAIFPYNKLNIKSIDKNGQEHRVMFYADKGHCVELVPCDQGYDIYYLKMDPVTNRWAGVEGFCTNIKAKDLTVTNIVTKTIIMVERIYKRFK